MTIAEKWFNKLNKLDEATEAACGPNYTSTPEAVEAHEACKSFADDLPLSAFRQVHVYVFEDGSGLIADTVSADCSIRVLDNAQVEHAKALNDAFGPDDPWDWSTPIKPEGDTEKEGGQ